MGTMSFYYLQSEAEISVSAEAIWPDQLLVALSDLLPRNHVKVPGIGGPTGGHPACPQMVGRSEQAARMVPLAVHTHTFTHAQNCRLLLCVLTARQARLPLCSPTG